MEKTFNKNQVIRLLFAGITLLTSPALNAQKIYDATILEKEILTPLPPKSPRINGPRVYGVRPGKQFIYRIPCQGERPIHFNAEGLPESLHLDPENGIITGISPEKTGNYNLIFEAKNKNGTDSLEFKIVVGEKTALTPPTGWNSWGGHMVAVSDKTMRDAADVFVKKDWQMLVFNILGLTIAG
jgi:alpha-galactosidase